MTHFTRSISIMASADDGEPYALMSAIKVGSYISNCPFCTSRQSPGARTITLPQLNPDERGICRDDEGGGP